MTRVWRGAIRISSKNTTSTTTASSGTPIPPSLLWFRAKQQQYYTVLLWKNQQHHALQSIQAFSVGAGCGLITSLAGLGGALLLIPMLTGPWFRLSQHAAHGTSLAAVAATGVSGAAAYSPHLPSSLLTADGAVVFVLAVSGMATAPLGARLATRLSGPALKRALAVLMLSLSVAVPLKDSIMSQQQPKEASTKNEQLNSMGDLVWNKMLPYALVGGASGCLAGLFGIGGGTIVVPALTLLSSDEEMSHYQILATSLAATSFPALVGCLAHARAGNIVIRVAPALCTGATCGAIVGGRVGQETDPSVLRTGLTALLAILGARSLWLR